MVILISWISTRVPVKNPIYVFRYSVPFLRSSDDRFPCGAFRVGEDRADFFSVLCGDPVRRSTTDVLIDTVVPDGLGNTGVTSDRLRRDWRERYSVTRQFRFCFDTI
jgi:hypothetical protein